jgi:hypothetical protein
MSSSIRRSETTRQRTETERKNWTARLRTAGFAHDSAPVSKFHRTPTALFDENFRFGTGLQYDVNERVTVVW